MTFQRHDIACQLDKRGHYELPLDQDFPFHVALFHLRTGHFTPTWNWHERLELTMPLDGPMRMKMGDQTALLSAGDILIVDNLKLHNYADFPGFNTRVITLTFMPEFVYAPGSPSCDYSFLLPFFAKRSGEPYILRAGEPMAATVTGAWRELLESYFSTGERIHVECGTKAHLLRILHHLTQRFHAEDVLRSEFAEHRRQADRLARVFEFVRANYAERISVSQAARLVHLSAPQFMKVFRRVSGLTFVAYVTRVRLSNALRLLRETNRTVADIASSTGFADQSYFDRRFKQTFGKTPRHVRAELSAATPLPTRRSGPLSTVDR